jgi:arylsulfatase A-like enzyme
VLTPRIDGIAAGGVVFDNFHCPSTVCMASRYATLTGHYCGRCPTPSFREKNPPDRPSSVGFNTHVLPDVEPTLGHVLQGAGYRTGYVGKWHTGPGEEALGTKWFRPDDDPADPDVAARLEEHQQTLCEQVRRTGFDYAGGISWGNPQPGDRQIRELEIHNLEWMTRAALDFVDESAASGRPFFLNYALTPIHGNGHIESLLTDERLTPAGYQERHLGCMPARATLYERLADAGLPFDYITAGALWMDDAIGTVLDRLAAHGLLENTIVVYTSDHGACEDKSTVYQGGVRIPCVLQWPGVAAPGRRVTALAQNIDWVPTFAEIAGAEIPEGMVLDGASLLPVLEGRTHRVPGRDSLYFEFGHARAVRTDRWKYLAYRLPEERLAAMREGRVERACDHNGTTGDVAKCLSLARHPDFFAPDQLYDLANDPDERHNLAGDPAYAEILAEMRRRLQGYLETFEHPYPLEREQPFLQTEAFRRLSEPYRRWEGMEDLLWWTRRWHHRPEDVAAG